MDSRRRRLRGVVLGRLRRRLGLGMGMGFLRMLFRRLRRLVLLLMGRIILCLLHLDSKVDFPGEISPILGFGGLNYRFSFMLTGGNEAVCLKCCSDGIVFGVMAVLRHGKSWACYILMMCLVDQKYI
jgi:hypothetical protein